MSIIGPFEETGLQASFESVRWAGSDLRSVGRRFQALGATTENALSPSQDWLVHDSLKCALHQAYITQLQYSSHQSVSVYEKIEVISCLNCKSNWRTINIDRLSGTCSQMNWEMTLRAVTSGDYCKHCSSASTSVLSALEVYLYTTICYINQHFVTYLRIKYAGDWFIERKQRHLTDLSVINIIESTDGKLTLRQTGLNVNLSYHLFHATHSLLQQAVIRMTYWRLHIYTAGHKQNVYRSLHHYQKHRRFNLSAEVFIIIVIFQTPVLYSQRRKIMLCTDKIRKQAGMVFTPPPPSQNYQEVE